MNSAVDSLGGLDQATQFSKIHERLGEELQPLGKDPRLAEVRHTLTLVDGTLLNALPKILQAVTLKEEKGTNLIALRKKRAIRSYERHSIIPSFNRSKRVGEPPSLIVPGGSHGDIALCRLVIGYLS